MSFNRTVPFYKLKEVLFSILFKCRKEEISEKREKIFNSETCKLCCFEETVESGILTAKEEKILKNLNEQKKRELLKVAMKLDKNTTFDRPNYIHLSSGSSLESSIIKIPTALTQMKFHMLRLFLEPLPYKHSYRHSFGAGQKKRLDQMEQEIIAFISSFPFGFKVKIAVSNSSYYLKTLKEFVPLPNRMIDSLAKSGNISIHQLFPETVGLNIIPLIEETLLSFWFTKFIQQTTRKTCRILHYRDCLLVLCKTKEEVKEAIDRFRDIMPGFGVDFDYSTLKFINVNERFSFLGKTYSLKERKPVCEPDQELFDCFLSYIYHLVKSPVVPLSEAAIQANIVILSLNLYFKGLVSGKF